MKAAAFPGGALPFFSCLLVGVLGGLLARQAAAEELQRYPFSRPLMGTVFYITLYAESEGVAAAAAEAAFDRVEKVNAAASDYLPESELSRFNRAPVGQPVALGEDLLFLLARAAEISQLTEGAFDVTSAYGVQHWRRARRKKKLPAEEETLKAVAMTDWRKIAVDKATGIATKHREGQLVDLGGIGKGYAADVALEVLRGRGITQALVAASGDLAIGDPPPGKEGWAVAVRTFEDKGENDRLRQVILSNCGCSTSGDLHQFLELNGTRYSHIVDPRTGLGLTSRVACTVVARDAATSDALATAFCVMGPDGVASLVAAHPGLGLKVRFSLMSDDGVQTKEMNFPPWQ